MSTQVRRGSALVQFRREAVELAEGTDLLNMAGDVHRDLAIVLEAAERGEEARAELERALGLYETKGNAISATSARLMLQWLADQLAATRP